MTLVLLPGNYPIGCPSDSNSGHWQGGFPGGSAVKDLPAMQEMRVPSLGWENPLEKEMATHSSILAMAPHSSTLAWKIAWTEEPGRLLSTSLLRVRQDWATSLSLFTFMLWRRKWQPTPVFLPGESQGWRSLWAAVYGVAQSQTRLKWLSSSSQYSCLGNPMDRGAWWAIVPKKLDPT